MNKKQIERLNAAMEKIENARSEILDVIDEIPMPDGPFGMTDVLFAVTASADSAIHMLRLTIEEVTRRNALVERDS